MKSCLVSFFVFIFFFIQHNPFSLNAQEASGLESNQYIVRTAERPPINLLQIPVEAYEAGKFKIKLKPERENLIPVLSSSTSPVGYVVTGIPSFDALNQYYSIKSYRPLFDHLYHTRSDSDQFMERHKAWGFHLWLEVIVDDKTDIIDAVMQFSALSEVDFAEPEYRKRLVINDAKFNSANLVISNENEPEGRWTPNDPQYGNQWHYKNTGQQGGTPGADISLQEAWNIEKGNSNVIVAVIDGGISYTHQDLASNMWSEIGYNFVNGSPTVTPHDHGTHVAGTIAAVTSNMIGVAGVAGGSGTGDGVRLMSCQVFSNNGSGGFHLAPIYAADNGASISQNSWGYSNAGVYDQSVLDAIDYFNVYGGGEAMNGGITLFSAGNSNSPGQWYPACYSGCFSVAATNNQDKKAWYSNYDTWVDISAPGGETNSVTARGVLSTLPNNSYGYFQGTSMACPHVSGVVALMISLGYGELTSLQIDSILRNTTDNHYNINSNYLGKLGSGRLNAHSALLAVQELVQQVNNPQSFKASAINANRINLTWVKNTSNNNVMVVWSLNNVFGTPIDGNVYNVGTTLPGGGKVLYRGSNTNFSHLNLQPLTTYYYKAFSFNSANEYSTGITASATTLMQPYADFYANPTTQVVSLPITFTDSSNGATFSSWFWDFGEGANPATTTGKGPHQVVYNTPGSKTVTLVVDNNYTKIKENYINILSECYSISETYSNGDIQTDLNFQTLPGSSSCPGSLTVSIPLGAVILGVDVSYNMTARNNGWKSEQRSQLKCVSPGGLSEPELYSGSGNSTGTLSYNRNGLNIANGVEGGGDIHFQLHAGRTFGGSGCNTVYNKVDNNTWNITVYYYLLELENPPIADFTATPTTVYAGETVNFTDLSTNNPTSWNWSFSGGTPTSSTTQNPQVVYNSPGTYNVSLTVSNAFGTDTKTKIKYITVLALPVPVADFTATPTTVYAGETVSFTDMSTNNPTSWNWSFSGGTPTSSTTQNPQVVYNSPGTYNVSLTVSNAFGTDTKTKIKYITVLALPVPVADFTATPTTVYAGETVSFTDMSTNNPTSWNWSFSGGTPTSSTTQNPQVVYNSPGTYNVSLTVSNAFGTDTKTKIKYITVLALPVPVADFTATPTTVYAGETVSFTDMSTNNPTSWNWSFSGGTPTSSTTQNPQVVYNSPGTYNVSLTVSNAFGTDTKTKIKYITVLDLPVPVADFTATPTTVYAGETVNFTDLSTNNPTSWNWSFSGGTPTSSTTQNPQIVYNSPGTYNVSLTVSNAFGTDTKTKTDYIHVSTPSIVNFTADQTIINQGEVVHFSDLSTGNPYFWLWEFQGGTPAINYQQNPTIIFKTPGTFTVKLTVSYANGQASLTREDYITVNELVSLFPPGWDVTLTSTQHVIAVPLDANPRILETPIEPGDFIGVFFTNTFGNLQCGGATMWDGQNNIAIISYGDQSYTPLKDGFSVYEDFKWKVYSYGHQREFDATPVYDVTLPNLGQFFPLGISALIDLSAGLLFNIHIPAGWSGISSPVLPFYPEMDTVLSSIQDNLTILYNFDGIYWPWQNINTLDKWKNSGYTIKMSNTDNLVIGGELIKSLSQTIKSGTGYLPIPTLYDVSTASLFAPFLDKLTLVRNILGTEVFWPQTGINTLPILKPGNAYITHAKSSFIVHFPQSGLKNSYSSPNSDFPELPLVSWSFAVASPDVHMISIPADGFKNLETGDIVGVFTPNNVCAGWAVFENQPLAIPVYGTHETGDEKSGFMANEPFTFRIFRPFNQLYCTAKALFDTTMPDQGIFRSGGISAISSLYPFDESFTNFSEEITVIPNPNNGIFVLSGVSNIEEIVVISQEGQIIKTIENNGTSELNVDISDNRKGIYLIKIIEKQRVYVKKVVIN